MLTTDAKEAASAFAAGETWVLFNGDCAELIGVLPPESVDLALTSPPYFMGKDYDRSYRVDDFVSDHEVIFPAVSNLVRQTGSICWQVGSHVINNSVIPLDFLVYQVAQSVEGIILRNRIVWAFEHGINATKRFSGRHETVLWFARSESSTFELDAVRVPQKYPGKRYYKGPKKGQLSGNPLGKNPGDVWMIPNVKANHVEKTNHPCQFPVGLCDRLVKALTPDGGVVFDPFTGSGSAGVSALMNGRRFLGAELSAEYCEIAKARLIQAQHGTAAFRDVNKPVWRPRPTDAVAQKPDHFVG